MASEYNCTWLFNTQSIPDITGGFKYLIMAYFCETLCPPISKSSWITPSTCKEDPSVAKDSMFCSRILGLCWSVLYIVLSIKDTLFPVSIRVSNSFSPIFIMYFGESIVLSWGNHSPSCVCSFLVFRVGTPIGVFPQCLVAWSLFLHLWQKGIRKSLGRPSFTGQHLSLCPSVLQKKQTSPCLSGVGLKNPWFRENAGR